MHIVHMTAHRDNIVVCSGENYFLWFVTLFSVSHPKMHPHIYLYLAATQR